ncbi:hypothetical protein VC83_03941 [Pseudogymnoascus destructans]|uniref:Uncharacterized protein n=2 Tax=Pseudogymnoascus destructans TaxID=655981 RepID=L8FLT7_PSED2|nr:uncharacterized protein VC83_03941 [Pseudogymnoascus destructans]ELR01897.1 hypothetical protein GMDG_05079 [Pseudogymnoascus destructans 20631-21]OAF59577.1 hypothetical protein VC83_03941 [Pseudogymnoascus destructans]
MTDDGDDGGFLAMDLGSSDSESGAAPKVKVPRDFQSQEDYEAQKASWKPTVDNGELYKTLDLPINNPSKQQFQTIIHAIEQLYFYDDFREASELAEKALEGDLEADYKKTIESYHVRCVAKLKEWWSLQK